MTPIVSFDSCHDDVDEVSDDVQICLIGEIQDEKGSMEERRNFVVKSR